MSLPPALLGPNGPRTLINQARHRLWPIVCEDSKRAVMRVLDRGILSGPFAPEAMAFQEEFADFVGAKHALLTHSGTSALIVALAAAGVQPGDEVIVPSYTFVATPLAVMACGGQPIFADVDSSTGLLLPAEVERWIGKNTKAIMPVHVHGCPADLHELGQIAHRIGASLVEDAAQAHGATYQGRPVGAQADGGGFSLQSSKNLGCGEGGVFVSNSLEQTEVANSVRNFGQDLSLFDAARMPQHRPLDGWRSLTSQRPGGMFRGNEMMAAFARTQLEKLPARTKECQENASRLGGCIAQLDGLTAPTIPPERTSVFHKYRISIDREKAGLADFEPTRVRDALVSAMKATGFEVTLWEQTSQTAQAVFSQREDLPERIRNNYRSDFPRTQRLLDSSLVLFSQSCPLIAQDAELVNTYAQALEELWPHRRAIVEAYEPT